MACFIRRKRLIIQLEVGTSAKYQICDTCFTQQRRTSKICAGGTSPAFQLRTSLAAFNHIMISTLFSLVRQKCRHIGSATKQLDSKPQTFRAVHRNYFFPRRITTPSCKSVRRRAKRKITAAIWTFLLVPINTTRVCNRARDVSRAKRKLRARRVVSNPAMVV